MQASNWPVMWGGAPAAALRGQRRKASSCWPSLRFSVLLGREKVNEALDGAVLFIPPQWRNQPPQKHLPSRYITLCNYSPGRFLKTLTKLTTNFFLIKGEYHFCINHRASNVLKHKPLPRYDGLTSEELTLFFSLSNQWIIKIKHCIQIQRHITNRPPY